jgi:hypothetical protein
VKVERFSVASVSLCDHYAIDFYDTIRSTLVGACRGGDSGRADLGLGRRGIVDPGACTELLPSVLGGGKYQVCGCKQLGLV